MCGAALSEKKRIRPSTFDIHYHESRQNPTVGFGMAPYLNSGGCSGHYFGVLEKKSATKGDSKALSKIILKPLVEN